MSIRVVASLNVREIVTASRGLSSVRAREVRVEKIFSNFEYTAGGLTMQANLA